MDPQGLVSGQYLSYESETFFVDGWKLILDFITKYSFHMGHREYVLVLGKREQYMAYSFRT